MATIIKQYANANNGGKERVTKDGDMFFVNSDWGTGFSGYIRVSREQMESCLRHTKAPADVVKSMLG